MCVQLFFDGQRDNLGEQELFAGFQEGRIEYKAEHKVLSPLRFPAIPTLSSPRGLEVCGNSCQLSDTLFVTDLIQVCLDRGKKVGVYPITEKAWEDMGEFSSLEEMLKARGLQE